MLSRAAKLDDILLMRAPGAYFLLRGPPQDMADKLSVIAERVGACRTSAVQLARDLGLATFLH